MVQRNRSRYAIRRRRRHVQKPRSYKQEYQKYPLDMMHNYHLSTEEFNQIYNTIKTLDLDRTQKSKGCRRDAPIFSRPRLPSLRKLSITSVSTKSSSAVADFAKAQCSAMPCPAPTRSRCRIFWDTAFRRSCTISTRTFPMRNMYIICRYSCLSS